MKRWFWALAMALGIFGAMMAAVSWFPKGDSALWDLPAFRLPATTSQGPLEISKESLLGKAWLANFVFTHCAGPCPLLTARMAGWQKDLPPGARLVTFTVDPDRDSVEVLRRYAQEFSADPEKWIFVTGDSGELGKLFSDGFKLPVHYDPLAPSAGRVTHSTRFVLVDKQGRVRNFFDMEDPDLDKKVSSALANAVHQ